MSIAKAWSEKDIPKQNGRVAFITGANSGIGWETAAALARAGADVVLACRTRSKADDARRRIEATGATGTVSVLDLDLSSLASVREAAAAFHAEHQQLDLLINNAGVMALPALRTADGFEMQIGTNHLGHFLLTNLLYDLVVSTPDSRVVTVSSNAHRFGHINLADLNSDKKYSAWGAYGQSKLANLLFTLELQRRFVAAAVSSIAVAAHPGWARTNLGTTQGRPAAKIVGVLRPPIEGLFAQSAHDGALPTLRAATEPYIKPAGYYGPSGFGGMTGAPEISAANARATDADMATKLWALSEKLVGLA